VPCPKCGRPPGISCDIPTFGVTTPRQFDQQIDGRHHVVRVRLAERHNARMAKRGYSREFTPRSERRVRFEVDKIPPTLFEAVKAKAKREGISLRALTLTLWKEWAEK